MLSLSLPAVVAGYIGCFTLVSASPAKGNDPVIWVGLEAALSFLWIMIWASNPKFDKETEITLGLKLTEHQPMITTDEYHPHITNPDLLHRKLFTLVPKCKFLEWITPFTGLLDWFPMADNITLYFTLITNHGINKSKIWFHKSLCLLITVFNFNMEIGVTLIPFNNSFHFFDVTVKYSTSSRQIEADVQSEQRDAHPWQLQDDSLFDSLTNYYQYVVGSFNWRHTNTTPTGRYICPLAQAMWLMKLQ